MKKPALNSDTNKLLVSERSVEMRFIGEPTRLDRWLAGNDWGFGRRRARKICIMGLVTVNQRPAKPGDIIADGMLVRVSLPEKTPSETAQAKPPNLFVAFEDRNLLVLKKQSGLHSVALSFGGGPSLAEIISSIYPKCQHASANRGEAGLVNRLDFDTSGLILVAKSRECWKRMRTLSKEGLVRKGYLALVEGSFPEGKRDLNFEIDLSKSKSKPKVRLNLDKCSKEHQTSVSLVSHVNSSSLISASLTLGTRHQVRAHLAAAGYPLVGDQLYGANTKYRDGSRKFFLHCNQLSFPAPFTGEHIEVYHHLFPDIL